MPSLFYGTLPPRALPRLYAPGLRPIESSLFDAFCIKNLAPHSKRKFMANHWHFLERDHTALSWHDGRGFEQTVFFPGLLESRQTVFLARDEFAGLIPGPLLFRITNPSEPYTYD